MGRDNSIGNERTFSERVNSYENLLNSIKVSKTGFDTTMKIKQSWKNEESEKDAILDNFEPLDNKEHIIKIRDESENLLSDRDYQQEVDHSPHI